MEITDNKLIRLKQKLYVYQIVLPVIAAISVSFYLAAKVRASSTIEYTFHVSYVAGWAGLIVIYNALRIGLPLIMSKRLDTQAAYVYIIRQIRAVRIFEIIFVCGIISWAFVEADSFDGIFQAFAIVIGALLGLVAQLLAIVYSIPMFRMDRKPV